MARAHTKKISTRQKVLAVILAALCCVATPLTRIPVPAAGGFIHAGDSVILVGAVFFGPFFGAVVGGIGSTFADIFAGAAVWAPFTLCIKGLMGFLAGVIADYNKGNKKVFSPRNVLAVFVCEATMVAGYFTAVMIMLDLKTASAAALLDLVQAGGGALIYFILAPVVSRVTKNMSFI